MGPYARAIEIALARLLERPRLLSPREWALVADWHSRGIPLAVVIEAFEDVGKRRAVGKRGSSSLRSLAYLVPSVEEGWQAICEGRVSRASQETAPLPARNALDQAWEAARRVAPANSALAVLLEDLCRRKNQGEDPTTLDDALDAAIEAAAPDDAVAAAERETLLALIPFRRRMSPKDFEKTVKRARVDRLRAMLQLPRLVLSR